jgi:hypothetical protein
MLHKSKTFYISFSLATISLSVFSYCCNLPAFAGTPETPSKTATGEQMPKPDRTKWESRSEPLLQVDQLKTKVDLPNLPEFTGRAKFLGGIVHPSDRGESYVMRFSAKEDAKLVIDWYKNTLNMYKWKIDYTDAQTVTAKMPTATCAIIVNDTSLRKNGSNAEIEINYFRIKNR